MWYIFCHTEPNRQQRHLTESVLHQLKLNWLGFREGVKSNLIADQPHFFLSLAILLLLLNLSDYQLLTYV